MKKEFVLFYGFVGIFSLIDLSLITGIVWQILLLSKNTLVLGVVLSLSVLIPFLFRKILIENLKIIKYVDAKVALIVRLIAFTTLLLMGFFIKEASLTFLLVIAICYGAINFLNLSSFEFFNTMFVLNGSMKAKTAARIMQTAIQIGACIGSMLGGYLISEFAISLFLNINFSLGILIAIFGIFTLKYFRPKIETKAETKTVNNAEITKSPHNTLAIMLCLSLGMIGFHIGSFNIITPIVYQDIFKWSAVSLGATSGTAGVGALLATFIPNRIVFAIILGFCIIVCDFILMFSGIEKLAIGMGFFIGFCINYTRISVKEQLIHLSINQVVAEKLASLSTLLMLLFQASAPLIVSLILLVFSKSISQGLFVLIGLSLALSLCLPLIKSFLLFKKS